MKFVKILVSIVTLGVLIFVSGSVTETAPGEEFTPASVVAALGDSITQAANVCEPWQECPEVSWATGLREPEVTFLPSSEEPGIYSVANRIANMPGGVGKDIKVFNNARSNTTTDSFPDQARLAVSQNAEFITILSGANDVCAADETLIISDTDFRRNVSSTLRILKNGLPKSKILFASIPNIYNLWEVSHNNKEAVNKWEDASLCQSMLANPLSEDKLDINRRERVTNRIIGFNKIIEEECDKTEGCLFDDNRLFDTKFTEAELSPVDYFHPNLLGQQRIAETMWTFGTAYHALVSRGVIKRSSPDAPLVEIVSPRNKETVYGKEYKAVVKVSSKSKIERVYADTQLGSIDLNYDKENDYWYLILDTTLAPNGISTFFTVVALDENEETTVTDKVTVTINNNFYNWEDYVDTKELAPSPSPSISAG